MRNAIYIALPLCGLLLSGVVQADTFRLGSSTIKETKWKNQYGEGRRTVETDRKGKVVYSDASFDRKDGQTFKVTTS